MRRLTRISLVSLLSFSLCSSFVFGFNTPLSDEAVRDAYFLGQRNDQSTLSLFDPYVRLLPKPDKGPFISEVEIYTPYGQVVENSRRHSMGYSSQQATKDYRRHSDRLFVRIRIDFTDTYGTLELYRSANSDEEQADDSAPRADFSRDFRVGLSQQGKWVEPRRIVLQTTSALGGGHYPFIPSDLPSSFPGAGGGLFYAYSSVCADACWPTGWLVWLEYEARDVASDDAEVDVFTTDGQHVVADFDLSRLR
jgi:hypothetical protein